MIVAEIGGLRCGRRISTAYQTSMLGGLRSVCRPRIAWDETAITLHDAAVGEARDASGLAHDPWLSSGCSFSKVLAWHRSASRRSCGQDRDRMVRR